MAAEEGSARYFGAEKKTQMKALGRLLEDIVRAETDSTEETMHSAVTWRKSVQSIINLCKAGSKPGSFVCDMDEATWGGSIVGRSSADMSRRVV